MERGGGTKGIGELLDRFKKPAPQVESKPTKKVREIASWQQLALDIMEDFKDHSHKGFYFSICKKYNEAFIRRIWANTKEGCKHSNYGAYFGKLLKVYNDQNKGIYTEFRNPAREEKRAEKRKEKV